MCTVTLFAIAATFAGLFGWAFHEWKTTETNCQSQSGRIGWLALKHAICDGGQDVDVVLNEYKCDADLFDHFRADRALTLDVMCELEASISQAAGVRRVFDCDRLSC